MPSNLTAYLPLTLMLVFGAAATQAFAATSVNVTLNNDPNMPMATTAGIGMSGDASTASMHVVSDQAVVPAGKVTFAVTNKSADLVHELLVVKATADTKLPYDAAAGGIDENKAGSLGEVSELDPGKSGTLTLTLQPGAYVLFCNVPGHFAAGMWTMLTVK